MGMFVPRRCLEGMSPLIPVPVDGDHVILPTSYTELVDEVPTAYQVDALSSGGDADAGA